MRGRSLQSIRHRRDGRSARYLRQWGTHLNDDLFEFECAWYYQEGYDFEDIDDWDFGNAALIQAHFSLVHTLFFPNQPLRALSPLLAEPLPLPEPVLAENPTSNFLIHSLATFVHRLVETPNDLLLAREIRQALGDDEAREIVVRQLPHSAEALCLFAPFWCRSPRSWSPESGRTLQEHLFATYPVPSFLVPALTEPIRFPDYKWLCWFILIGRSASLKAAGRVFGWDIPGKFAHFLSMVPPTIVTPKEACLYAEVLRRGGTTTDYQRLRANASYYRDPTDVSISDEDFGFWSDTVDWLIRHAAELTDRDAEQVLDWAWHGHTEFLAGHEGAFSWTGRSVAATRERARIYTAQQHADRYRWRHYSWKHHGWDSAGTSGWSITELTDSNQLNAEGAAMQHCVWSYGWRCAAGMSAIFTVCHRGQRRVTVELNPAMGAMVQVRGLSNRDPDPEELQVVTLWHQSLVLPAFTDKNA